MKKPHIEKAGFLRSEGTFDEVHTSMDIGVHTLELTFIREDGELKLDSYMEFGW
jgi:hypothetical protein